MGILGFTMVSLNSCQKDDFSTLKDPTWSPELAFPLVYSELTLSDLVHADNSGTTVTTDPDQFATLYYEGNTINIDASSIVNIPDQGFNSSISLNSAQLLALNTLGALSIQETQTITLDPGQNTNLDSLLCKAGQLQFELDSDFPATVQVDFELPNLTRNGYPLNYSAFTTNGSSTNNTISEDLANYKFDLTKSNQGVNSIDINLTLSITDIQSPITTQHSTSLEMKLSAIDYQTVFGYFGQRSFLYERDSVHVSIFENSTNFGSFIIADPKLNFLINNSMGIPLEVTIPEANAFGTTFQQPISGIPSPIPTVSPGINEIGATKTTDFALNNTNSNLTAVISSQPNYIFTQGRMSLNPVGQSFNFLTDESALTVDVTMEIPLYGSATNFRVKDTLPFSYDDLDNVNTLELKTSVSNTFPIEAAVQIIFTDENFQPLDSLFLPGEVTVPAGIIDPETGKVSIAGVQDLEHIFNRNRIKGILNSKHIIVNGYASTVDAGSSNVKIYTDYTLNVKIGAKAKINVK